MPYTAAAPAPSATWRTARPGALFGVLLLVACMLLAACSAPPKSRLRSVEVVAAIDANHGSPTALDLVFVYDVEALKRLPGTGPAWFESKRALAGELGNAIEVLALEISPGSVFKPSLSPAHEQAIAVFSYTNYEGKAGHQRGVLTGFRKMRIHLAADRVDYMGEQ